MIFRNLPALITLVAALVAWIVTFIYKYELTKALIIIFAAAFIFFVIGIIVRAILNRFLNPDTDKKVKTEETEEAEDTVESNETEEEK